MLQIEEFKLQDLDHIKDPVISDLPDLQTMKHLYAGWTLLDDRTVLGCGGVVTFDQRVGTMWTKVSRRVLASHKARRILLLGAYSMVQGCHTNGMRRLQASVILGKPRANVLVRHLGFELEGIMHEFGPDGESAELWAHYGREIVP